MQIQTIKTWFSTAFKKEFRILRLIVLGVWLIFFLIPFIYVLSVIGDIPPIEEIENPQINLATEIYSVDNQLLGDLYFEEHRVNVRKNEISGYVFDALVATEDVRFYDHPGVDMTALFRVAIKTVLGGDKSSGGGSTISQQLARNLWNKHVGFEHSVSRKIKEMIVAVVLEKNFTKDEIMVAYLNTVPWGSNLYGIEAASKTYFDKNAKDLNKEEAALLVGMLKGPTQFSPIINPQNSIKRRNVVLSQMEKYDFISKAEFQKLKNKPLKLDYSVKDHNYGIATYFRDYLQDVLKKWAKENGYNVYTDGLKVYTTIHSKMQKHAENAVKEHISNYQKVFDKHIKGREQWLKDSTIIERAMKRCSRWATLRNAGMKAKDIRKTFFVKQKMRLFSWDRLIDTTLTPWDSLKYYSKFLEAGFMAMDPYTGEVRAWVGGINHDYFKYDHVFKGKRQVGSTFKPFVYTAAFDNGYSPCRKVKNEDVFFYNEDGKMIWSPKNSGKSGGEMRLRKALAHSVNKITARVMKDIGVETVVKYAHAMGIQSKLEKVPSLALGTTDLSLFEMVGAYSTFVNKGIWTEPVVIMRIEDKFGNVIYTNRPKTKQALSAETAYMMLDMLKAVVNGGTAGRLRPSYKFSSKLDIGGKTGTTQNNSDGWFMGITPYLAGGAWVGHADRNVHFLSTYYGQGAAMALPIWGLFMKKVIDDESIGIPGEGRFEKPDGFDNDILNCKVWDKEHKNETGSGGETSGTGWD